MMVRVQEIQRDNVNTSLCDRPELRMLRELHQVTGRNRYQPDLCPLISGDSRGAMSGSDIGLFLFCDGAPFLSACGNTQQGDE
jgi:hypothetical protein